MPHGSKHMVSDRAGTRMADELSVVRKSQQGGGHQQCGQRQQDCSVNPMLLVAFSHADLAGGVASLFRCRGRGESGVGKL